MLYAGYTTLQLIFRLLKKTNGKKSKFYVCRFFSGIIALTIVHTKHISVVHNTTTRTLSLSKCLPCG